MSESTRTGPFWDVLEGRRPPPPAAVTLGFKLLEIDPPTIELKVNFIKPAPPGILIGEGRVVARGGTIAFLAGELRTEPGSRAGWRRSRFRSALWFGATTAPQPAGKTLKNELKGAFKTLTYL